MSRDARFPEIRDVVVAQVANNEVEIRISQLHSDARREDLAVPLAKCGTGVSQVLAMLYVIVTADTPRILLIDEPNSFLHPGATRELLRIFKRFPLHQYVIATHSPEVIAEVGDAPMTVMEWKEQQCHGVQLKATDAMRRTASLNVVGARLSDVFGFDEVLWVEGPSDAQALDAIYKNSGIRRKGLAIVPVRTTGAFERARVRESMEIYTQLTSAGALMPPAIAFIFDMEGRSEGDRQSLIRESKGKISFIRRRMIENYLLDVDAICVLLTKTMGLQSSQELKDRVHEWIDSNIANRKYAGNGVSIKDLAASPLVWTHGKKLLKDLVEEFTETRHTFLNTRDVPFLVDQVLASNPEHLKELEALLRSVLSPQIAVQSHTRVGNRRNIVELK